MIRYKKDTDNIVTLTLDMKGRHVNIINHEVGKAFVPVIEHLKEEKIQGKLRGIIITSAKKTFLAGGDLEYLLRTDDASQLFQYSQTLQALYRDLERPGVPVVAAINGSAMGSGFELALACHHRVAIDQPNIRLGHPEVTMGLMPGSGGVIRLLWLLGIERAYSFLSSGQRFSPKEALEVGIVDELAKNEEELLDKSRAWLLDNQEYSRPWDMPGEYVKGGGVQNLPVAEVVQRLAAGLFRDTRGNFPAPQAILNTLAEGSKVDFDTACKIESRYFTKLLLSRASRNMTKAFWFDYNAIKEGQMRPKGFGKFRPKKVGVIGAGVMGSGIALSCLLHDMKVVLKDISKAIAERGRDFVEQRLEERVQAGRLSQDKRDLLLKRIITTDSSQTFAECDIVLEAVFENEMVKKKVTREAEDFMDEEAVFATNTISIPITELGNSALRPQHYIGLHFFDPVADVPVVEVVRGEQTSDETVARAFDFARTIRKIPIMVKDSWGFYVSRVQNTYILEGIQLLHEGYPPALIENMGLQAGMPMGALALADDLSLELVLTYENQAAKHYGSKYIQHPAVDVLRQMLEEYNRPGKIRRAGFYDYQEENSSHLWPGLIESYRVSQTSWNEHEIIERFLFVQVLEALWCMHEKIVTSIPEMNLGSIYGWGFPAFKGGVMQYIEDYGVEAFVDKCQYYEDLHGPRFKVPGLLLKKVKEGLSVG